MNDKNIQEKLDELSNERIAWQVQCYGCTEDVLKASILRLLRMPMTTPKLMATSILSDAQEEIERGLNERARQSINCAKWVINQNWKQNSDGEWIWQERKG